MTNYMPQTLREALNIHQPESALPRTDVTMDLTIAKIQDIIEITKKDWIELSNPQFTHQALAMNKIASIQSKLEELIISLQSDLQ